MPGLNLKVKKLTPQAILPSKTDKYDHPAGIDLYSSEKLRISGNSVGTVKTGIAVKIPEGYYGQLFTRSGAAKDKHLVVTAGVIDSDFRGEIIILVGNFQYGYTDIMRGEKIAQMVLLPVPDVTIEQVSELEGTKRGEKGFGSSNNK